MKRCFTKNNIITAPWWMYDGKNFINQATNKAEKELPYPILAKSFYGSRNKGNSIFYNEIELDKFIKSHDFRRYIFEKYMSYKLEYRLHCTQESCFLAFRKAVKKDTEDSKRWFKNSANCVWLREDNNEFMKPSNWEHIQTEAVRAIQAVGLDIGAVDLRVQGPTDKDGKSRKEPAFFIIETNSAPSLAEMGVKAYLEQIPQILTKKHKCNE